MNNTQWTDSDSSDPTDDEDSDVDTTDSGDEPETPRELLRAAVRGHYDMQKLRIQAAARTTKKAEHAEAVLSKKTKEKLTKQSELFDTLERNSLSIIRDYLKEHKISKWLEGVRGCGPTMAGVLIAEIDITRANYPSSLWRYCGLHVVEGVAARRRKGQKVDYNPWLKSKVLKVLGDCMLKAGTDPKTKEPTKYRVVYDNYKHRKKSQRIRCMACDGTGIAARAVGKQDEAKIKELISGLSPLQIGWLRGDGKVAKLPAKQREHLVSEEVLDEYGELTNFGLALQAALPEEGDDGKQGKKKGTKPQKKCANCEGTGTGPWGKSDAHRHNAAMRAMVKALLVDLWVEWRKLEGLPIVPTYAEAKLGIVHGEHTSTAHMH